MEDKNIRKIKIYLVIIIFQSLRSKELAE